MTTQVLYSDTVFIEKYFLYSSACPVRAFISLCEGKISEIHTVSSETEKTSRLSGDSSILDFSGFCVFPGLIDLNSKHNGSWEGLAKTTYCALQGGITTLAVEKDFFNLPENPITEIYCDVGTICRAQGTAEMLQDPAPLAYKTYLCTQSDTVHAAEHLGGILERASSLGKTLIVDASVTNSRLLYVASPLRTLDLEQRLEGEKLSERVSDFSMAVDLSISDCGSDPDTSESEESPGGVIKLRSAEKRNTLDPRPSDASKELAATVGKLQLCFKELSEAELDKYSGAGTTFFRSHSEMPPEVPKVAGPGRLKSLRPPILNVLRPTVNETDYNNYLMNIPSTWECQGIQYCLSLLQGYPDLKIVFSNIASAEAVAELVKCREKFKNVLIETCPHYLYYSSDDIQPKETALKTFPPIRTKMNRDVLLKFMLNGGVDLMSSHHNPNSAVYKIPEFRVALPGVITMGASLQVLWSQIKTETSFETAMGLLLKTMCYNPAKLLGIDGHKGGIAVGKQADLVVWSPFKRSTCALDERNIYNGKLFSGKVSRVYLRGELALDESTLLAHGQFI